MDGAGFLQSPEPASMLFCNHRLITKMLAQAKQQGGVLVFDGHNTLWRYNDPATSAHAKPEQILNEGLKGLSKA